MANSTITSTSLKPGVTGLTQPRYHFFNTWLPILFCIGIGLTASLIAYFHKSVIAFAQRVWPLLDWL